MNNAKLTITALAAFMLCGATCRSPDRLRHIELSSKLAAYTTTAVLLERHPEYIGKVDLARTIINEMLAADTISPETLATAVQYIPVDSFQDGSVRITITSLLLIYADTVGSLDVEQPEVVRAVGRGILDGLTLAQTGAERRSVP